MSATGLPVYRLDDLVVRGPEKTCFLRAAGESMPGGLLVVKQAEDAPSGKMVIAAVDGEMTVKPLRRRGGRVLLRPENPA